MPSAPLSITPNPKRVRVLLDGVVIADTTRALVLREGARPGVQYIPRADADMSRLSRTQTSTHCPLKGDAAYYTITTPARVVPDAVWSYETPFPGAAAIAGYLAFYPNRVDAIEEVAA